MLFKTPSTTPTRGRPLAATSAGRPAKRSWDARLGGSGPRPRRTSLRRVGTSTGRSTGIEVGASQFGARWPRVSRTRSSGSGRRSVRRRAGTRPRWRPGSAQRASSRQDRPVAPVRCGCRGRPCCRNVGPSPLDTNLKSSNPELTHRPRRSGVAASRCVGSPPSCTVATAIRCLCARRWIVDAWTGPVAAAVRFLYRRLRRPDGFSGAALAVASAQLLPWLRDRAVVLGARSVVERVSPWLTRSTSR